MNALTKVESRPLQPAQAPRQNAAQVVLKAEGDALAIMHRHSDLSRLYHLTEQRLERCQRESDGYGIPPEQRETQLREMAEIDLSRGAEEQDLRDLVQDMARALGTGPHRQINRILAGLLLDAFPQAQGGQPETFIEVLVADISELGFAPIVVAHALQGLRRTVKFRPTIAEVCEACSEAKRTLGSKLSALEFRADTLSRRAKRAAQFVAERPRSCLPVHA